MAIALSVFVIGGGAFGVMAMMERNAILEVRSQRRMDLDRAINYIADDIKSANSVEVVKRGSTFPRGAAGVLYLTIPGGTDAPQRVYFIRPSTATWSGPNTINRFTGTVANPGNVTGGDVLVDGIIAPDNDELARIQQLCVNDGGNFQGTSGFYACINETTDTVGLYLYGRLQYSAGQLKNDPTLDNLALTTRVSARATLP